MVANVTTALVSSLASPGMSVTTGASLIGLIVNVAVSLSDNATDAPSPVSVAVKVMVSEPFQLAGAVIVATLATMSTVRLALPLAAHTILASAVSTSDT